MAFFILVKDLTTQKWIHEISDTRYFIIEQEWILNYVIRIILSLTDKYVRVQAYQSVLRIWSFHLSAIDQL